MCEKFRNFITRCTGHNNMFTGVAQFLTTLWQYWVLSLVVLGAATSVFWFYVAQFTDICYKNAASLTTWSVATAIGTFALTGLLLFLWLISLFGVDASTIADRKRDIRLFIFGMFFPVVLYIPSASIADNFNRQLVILSETETPQTINELKAKFVKMKNRTDYLAIDTEIKVLLNKPKQENPEETKTE